MESFQSLGARSYDRPWVQKSVSLQQLLRSPTKDRLTKKTEKSFVAFYRYPRTGQSVGRRV